MKRLIAIVFIFGLCATWAFAANEVPLTAASEPAPAVKTEQAKTTKVKTTKKNKKVKKSAKKEDTKEVIAK